MHRKRVPTSGHHECRPKGIYPCLEIRLEENNMGKRYLNRKDVYYVNFALLELYICAQHTWRKTSMCYVSCIKSYNAKVELTQKTEFCVINFLE